MDALARPSPRLTSVAVAILHVGTTFPIASPLEAEKQSFEEPLDKR